MGRKKVKKFIDKNNSITFQLVGRSQNDPLFVDETAPQYVLVEKKSGQEVSIDSKEPEPNGSDPQKSLKDRQKRREEQIKYGIYFDDDYNYLQHLTDVTEIALPKAALPVGPQLDWDPDVVEAMEDDFDFDDPNNQIDDDFVMQAMHPHNGNKNERIVDINDTIDDYRIEQDEVEDAEDNLSVCGFNGNDDGQTVKTSASTHFTEYSMSSSVLPRNEKLQTLDEQFEQMFIREYADQMEIGALDTEEISGDIDPNRSDLMAKLVEEYEQFKSGTWLEYERNEQAIDYVRRKYLKSENNDNQIMAHGDDELIESSSDSEKEEVVIVDTGRKGDKDRFDCESILSVYSNTNYHPKVLNESIDRYGNKIVKNSHIRIDQRTGMPTKTGSNLGMNTLVNLDGKSTRSNMSRLSELSVRLKNETTDERRQRKKELKELRAERRAEKKANRLAFNEEKIRLHKADMNKSVQKKVTVN
ncbi:ltv1-like protein [Dermatophagoides farinae]|uniref:Protein LTV1 homolog n=1 Tax=Dermatophagoides farinae TaxID=6954 RepID=A0A9D4P0G7_DERFA|nr:ltv1-like protein [Dermatophagoides farinae]